MFYYNIIDCFIRVYWNIMLVQKPDQLLETCETP